jgi:DtxR family transcriptional regulator, Mn-dependent transcriptional regulator
MTKPKALTASLEDYLETISCIIAEKEAVRPKDIARRLKIANSSVTGALRTLAEKKFIHYAPYDVITLTDAGKDAAKDVIRRHEVLRDFFVNVLSVEPSEADRAACQMEHSIPRGILERFVLFARFVEVCPRGGESWISGFEHFFEHGGKKENCAKCLSLAVKNVQNRPASGKRGES